MDYGKILDSTYKWISFKGSQWYAAFFLITIGLFVVVPMMIRQGIFFDEPSLPVVQILYAFNFVILFVGFFSLIEYLLKANSFTTQKVTPGKLLDSIFLLILTAWYIFVWNIERKHRIMQLLVLFVYAFSLFSIFYFVGTFLEAAVSIAALIFGIIYLGFVISNCVRLSFSYFIFYNTKFSIKHSILESWKITEGRVFEILGAYIVGEVTVLVFGSIIVFVVASLVSFAIAPNFIPPVTYKLAMLIGGIAATGIMLVAEQAFIVEAYSQVELKHSIKKKVNNILAKRTLKKSKPAKKKSTKKKSTKKPKKKAKKSSKKKSTKKKSTKKPKKKAKKSSKKK